MPEPTTIPSEDFEEDLELDEFFVESFGAQRKREMDPETVVLTPTQKKRLLAELEIEGGEESIPTP